MTEEKQGAAEWLRGIIGEYEASGARSCCAMAEMFGIDCDEIGTCQECRVKTMRVIADRIDAERALPEGIEWPRFEDGELVRPGDEVGSDEPFTANEIAFEPERWLIKASSRSVCGYFHGSYGEPVKRPTPKVLGADGAPIEVGDTVYFVGGSGTRFAVKDIDFKPDGPFVDIIDEDRYSATVNPESLTHERPDSWERLEADAKKKACDIAGSSYCGNCRFRHGIPFLSCDMKARIELVERAKALAKAGE